MSISEERYVEITRPGESSGGGNSGEVRDLKRRLDQHIGSGGQAHAVATETAAGFMSQSDKVKLDGVQNNATENMPDDYLLARGNQTGVQDIETINGLRQELNELGGAELEELVDRAEAAADLAEAASNSAFVNADVKSSIEAGLSGPEAVEVGEQFQVLAANGLEYRRYRKDSETVAVEVGDGYPSASAPALRSFDASEPSIAHAFTDKDLRLLAHIDSDGKMHASPSDDLKRKTNFIEKREGEFLFAVTDLEKKVVFHIDDVDVYYKGEPIGRGVVPPPTPLYDAVNNVPVSNIGQEFAITKIELIKKKIDISTIAEGRDSSPPIAVNGDGLTHPSAVYVPGGWNGYEYWLAATPFFGVIGGDDAYENPHVFASNDLQTWVEPSGGRLDKPENRSGCYWSDTHLALGDDGCLHLFYRGVGFTGMAKGWVHRKSRDGINWSEREVILNSNEGGLQGFNDLLSPAFFQSEKGTWNSYFVATQPPLGWTDTDYGGIRRVLRRTSMDPTSYGEMDETQTVKYENFSWPDTLAPWHIDACKVGNLTLHLINTSPRGTSNASHLYLAYSSDGWNFRDLGRVFDINMYRSTIIPLSATQDRVELAVIAAHKNGQMDLYNITLGVN